MCTHPPVLQVSNFPTHTHHLHTCTQVLLYALKQQELVLKCSLVTKQCPAGGGGAGMIGHCLGGMQSLAGLPAWNADSGGTSWVGCRSRRGCLGGKMTTVSVSVTGWHFGTSLRRRPRIVYKIIIQNLLLMVERDLDFGGTVCAMQTPSCFGAIPFPWVWQQNGRQTQRVIPLDDCR